MSVHKHRADDGADVVAYVEKTPSTHAKGMRDLVGIGINVRQGEPTTAMRVDFELNCGTSSLLINGGNFVVSLRTCFVVLGLANCEIQPQTRYESRLMIGSVEATATETRERSDDGEIGGGVDASVEVDGGGSLLPRVGLLLRASKKRKATNTAQETLKRQPRIDLVVTAGQDRWQVGDPRHGDARRGDGRLLGSYFGEERDREGEAKPLCVIAASDPASTSTMTASAVIRVGQLQIHLGNELATYEQREDVEAAFRERGRRVAAQHRRREKDLRACMAGLVLAKAMHAAQRSAGLPIAEGEVLIAQQTLVTAPRRALKVAQ